ncbi:hypothetical protein Ahia01_001048600, partial [Argonauta hians]
AGAVFTPYKKCDQNKPGLIDCGGKVCLNDASRVDDTSCDCNCLKGPGYEGPQCALNCSKSKDNPVCGTQFKEDFCSMYSNVPPACPEMCKICPYANYITEEPTTTKPTTTNPTTTKATTTNPTTTKATMAKHTSTKHTTVTDSNHVTEKHITAKQNTTDANFIPPVDRNVADAACPLNPVLLVTAAVSAYFNIHLSSQQQLNW